MSEESGKVYLENVYDQVLDKALLDVQISFHDPDARVFWSDLYKLAIFIRDPPTAHDELMRFIRDTEAEISVRRAPQGYTFADRYMRNTVDINSFLRTKSLELLDLAVDQLQKSGYLTRRARRMQSNIVGKDSLFDGQR